MEISVRQVIPLTPGEKRRLLDCLVEGHGESATEEHLRTLIEWATQIRLNAHALDLILEQGLPLRLDPQGQVLPSVLAAPASKSPEN